MSEKLYRDAIVLRSQLEEKLSLGPSLAAGGGGIRKHFGELDEMVNRLQIQYVKEPLHRREILREKVEQLRFDVAQMKSSWEDGNKQHRKRELAEKRREELLNTKFVPNSDTIIAMDDEAMRLSNANSFVSDITAQGQAALGDLVFQRSMLKGTRRRLLDVANTLGLSNTVMRLIENRSDQDRLILWGGMLGTTILMAIIYHYFG